MNRLYYVTKCNNTSVNGKYFYTNIFSHSSFSDRSFHERTLPSDEWHHWYHIAKANRTGYQTAGLF
jgi:hypothetical protein